MCKPGNDQPDFNLMLQFDAVRRSLLVLLFLSIGWRRSICKRESARDDSSPTAVHTSRLRPSWVEVRTCKVYSIWIVSFDARESGGKLEDEQDAGHHGALPLDGRLCPRCKWSLIRTLQAMLILSNTSHCQSTLSAFLVVQRAFASLILHTMCTWRSLGHNFYDSYKVFLSNFLISNAFSERISKMKINKSGLNVCGKLVTLLLKLISWKFQVISKPLSSRENWTFLA